MFVYLFFINNLQYGYGNYDPQQFSKQGAQEQQQVPQTSQPQQDQAAQKATKKVGMQVRVGIFRFQDEYEYEIWGQVF